MAWPTAESPDQAGTVAVVTGADGGLGLERRSPLLVSLDAWPTGTSGTAASGWLGCEAGSGSARPCCGQAVP
jgi:hypothetical protein